MKIKRQRRIVELVKGGAITTQEELLALLRVEGFEVTQATISRDVREMGLFKANDGSGSKYVLPKSVNGGTFSERYYNVLREGFISAEDAGNILVVNTVSGMAMAVAAAIDAMELTGVVGTIAGDDTIFCALKDAAAAPLAKREIYEIVGE